MTFFDSQGNLRSNVVADAKDERIDLALFETLIGHTATVRALALGPDGTLYSVSDDGTIRVWNTTECRYVNTLNLRMRWATVKALALAPDGTLYSG